MTTFVRYAALTSSTFAFVFVGYLIACWRGWRIEWTRRATQAVFIVLVPALLFKMMSNRASMAPVDGRLLLAFFGGCLVVFGIGRVIAARVFHLDGVAQSIFAMGGIFSNNVMLGLPLAKMTLGDEALPSVALVLVFNALILWTLVAVSVEWSRHGAFTLRAFGRIAVGVLTNPVVAAILAGSLYGLSPWRLPTIVGQGLDGLSALAAPSALLVLGMGLAGYSVRREWRQAAVISALKLMVQPVVVGLLAVALRLPPLETKVVVLLGAIAVGANVYLMSMQFERLQGTIATSLVMSTALSVLTIPVALSVVSWLG